MSSDSLGSSASKGDLWDLGQLWSNVMPLLILALMSATLLALSPWGYDLPNSLFVHFFTLFPLVVLALVTYVARAKLFDEEREIPSR